MAETLDWTGFENDDWWDASSSQTPLGTTMSPQSAWGDITPKDALSWAQSQYDDAKSRGGLQTADDELAYNILFGTDLTRSTEAGNIALQFGDNRTREFVNAVKQSGRDIYVKEFDQNGMPVFYVNENGVLNHYVYDSGDYHRADAGWSYSPDRSKGKSAIQLKSGNWLSFDPLSDEAREYIRKPKELPDYNERVANAKILEDYLIDDEGKKSTRPEDSKFFLNDKEVMDLFKVDAGVMRHSADLLDKYKDGKVSELDLVKAGLLDEKTYLEALPRIQEGQSFRAPTLDEAQKMYNDEVRRQLAEIRKEYPDYGKTGIKLEEFGEPFKSLMGIPVLKQILDASTEAYTQDGKTTVSVLGGTHLIEIGDDGIPRATTKVSNIFNPVKHAQNTWNILSGVVFTPIEDYVIRPAIAQLRQAEWKGGADPEFWEVWERWSTNYYQARATGDAVPIGDQWSDREYIVRNLKEQMEKGGIDPTTEALLEGAVLLALTFWTPGGAEKAAKQVPAVIRAATEGIGKSKAAINVARTTITKSEEAINALKLQRDALSKLRQTKAVRLNVAQVDAKIAGHGQNIVNMQRNVTRHEKNIERLTGKLGQNPEHTMFMQATADTVKTEVQLQSAQKMLSKAIKSGNQVKKTKALDALRQARYEHKMAMGRMSSLANSVSGVAGLGKLPAFTQFIAEKFANGFKGNSRQWKQAATSYMAMARSLSTASLADVFKLKEFAELNAKTGEVLNVAHNTGKGYSRHIAMVIEHGDDYVFTSGLYKGKKVSEHPEVIGIKGLLKERFDMLKSIGIAPEQVELISQNMWVGRFAAKQAGEAVGKGFGKKTQEIERVFNTADEGIKAGEVYATNYRQTVARIMDDAYKMVAEKHLSDYMKTKAVDILPSARIASIKAIEATATKLKGIKKIDDATRTYLTTVSAKLRDAVARNAPEDEIMKLVSEAIDSAEAVTSASTPLVSLSLRGVEGLKFAEADAKLFSDAMKAGQMPTGTFGKVVGTLQTMASVTRFMLTAYDVGAPWIHGFPALFNNAKVWAESWGRMFKAMGSEKWLYGYISNNKAVVNDMIARGHMVFASAEYMEGVAVLSKIPYFDKVTNFFERGFTSFLDTSRIEMFKALSKPGMDNAYARAIGSHVDRLMGAAHYTNLGASRTSMALQSIFFFAPRYYRSCLGLYKNIVSGDIRGPLALQSIARMQAGMHISYYAMCRMMGQEAYLNPLDSRYLSFKIGNSYVGYGSFNRGLNRLLVRVGNQIANGDYTSITPTILDFARGKLSSLMRIPADLLYGVNILGNDIYDEGFLKGVLQTGQEMLPIFVQAMLDEAPGDDFIDRLVRGASEFVGLRSVGYYEHHQLQDARDTVSMERHGISYYDLKKEDPRAALQIDDDPVVREYLDAYERAREERDVERWDVIGKQYKEYRPIYSDIQVKRRDDGFAACEDYRKGIITADEFRAKIAELNEVRSAAIDELNAKYPEIANRRYDPRDIPDDATRQFAAYWTYMDTVIGSNKLKDEDLDKVEYSKLKNELDQQFIEVWGRELYDYVQVARFSGKGLHPIEVNFSLDKDDIVKSEYWDINPLTPEGREAELQFRASNPHIDALLFRWGYKDTIQTEDAKALAQSYLEDIGVYRTVPDAVQTSRLRSVSTESWEYVNGNKANASKLHRSVFTQDMVNQAYRVHNEILSLQRQAQEAILMEKKAELVDKVKGEVMKLMQINELINAHQSEPYLDYFKVQMRAWLADHQIRWGYISGFK